MAKIGLDSFNIEELALLQELSYHDGHHSHQMIEPVADAA
jgi:hypothetical protein